MPGEREVRIGEQRGVDRAERVDPTDAAQIEIVALGDDLDVVLGLGERVGRRHIRTPGRVRRYRPRAR